MAGLLTGTEPERKKLPLWLAPLQEKHILCQLWGGDGKFCKILLPRLTAPPSLQNFYMVL